MPYPIYNIPTESYDVIEQIGTKEKFWYYDKGDKAFRMFKVGRYSTGENWAEKVACELAKLLCLPCASYDFAVWSGKEGVVSPLFVPLDGRLIHGNEILPKVVKNYPKKEFYNVREYTLSAVLAIIKRIPVPPIGMEHHNILKKAMGFFVGYLMFDCWISNPDRHHENWGVVFNIETNSLHLAPTYDHASGLGCRVLDAEREKRLTTNDSGFNVNAFVNKAKSAFFGKNLKLIKTNDAFKIASIHDKVSALYWLDKLKNLSNNDIHNIFSLVPKTLITESAIKFAKAVLNENKKRLLSIKIG